MIGANAQKSSTLKKLIIPALCVVDILMFPYIRALSCSLSMIIIVLWCLFHIGSIPVKHTISVVIPMVVVSVLFGIFVHHSMNGLSTAILVIYSMLLFYYVSHFYNVDFKEIISKILFIYITLVFALAVLYAVAPQTYFSVRAFWTMSNTKIEFTSLVINRFTFVYSDPNNAGCALTAIYAYVLICERHKMWRYIYYIAALGVSVLLTMSVQAAAMFALISVVFLLLRGEEYKVAKKAMRIVMIAALAVVICLGGILLSNSKLLDSIFDRLTGGNLSTAGGRMSYWTDTIINALGWENILIGKGSVIDSAGKTYLPHSGNLYMTISYGLITNIAYVIAMFVLPRHTKRRYYLILLPFMMIYTINTGVSDYRFISVMAMLSAVIHKQASCDLELTQAQIEPMATEEAEEPVFVGKADDREELA